MNFKNISILHLPCRSPSHTRHFCLLSLFAVLLRHSYHCSKEWFTVAYFECIYVHVHMYLAMNYRREVHAFCAYNLRVNLPLFRTEWMYHLKVHLWWNDTVPLFILFGLKRYKHSKKWQGRWDSNKILDFFYQWHNLRHCNIHTETELRKILPKIHFSSFAQQPHPFTAKRNRSLCVVFHALRNKFIITM